MIEMSGSEITFDHSTVAHRDLAKRLKMTAGALPPGWVAGRLPRPSIPIDECVDQLLIRKRRIIRACAELRAIHPLGTCPHAVARSAVAGKWVARHHFGSKNEYLTETFGTADGFSDADGVAILDFWQAQSKAREQMVRRAHSGVGKKGSRTVGDAIEGYLEFLETHLKSAAEARSSANAYILPALGKIKLDDLKANQISKWLAGVAKSPARVRTKKGASQRFRAPKAEDDPDELERAENPRPIASLRR